MADMDLLIDATTKAHNLVVVDESGWTTRFRYEQAGLLERFAAELGEGVVTRIDGLLDRRFLSSSDFSVLLTIQVCAACASFILSGQLYELLSVCRSGGK